MKCYCGKEFSFFKERYFQYYSCKNKSCECFDNSFIYFCDYQIFISFDGKRGFIHDYGNNIKASNLIEVSEYDFNKIIHLESIKEVEEKYYNFILFKD